MPIPRSRYATAGTNVKCKPNNQKVLVENSHFKYSFWDRKGAYEKQLALDCCLWSRCYFLQ